MDNGLLSVTDAAAQLLLEEFMSAAVTEAQPVLAVWVQFSFIPAGTTDGDADDEGADDDWAPAVPWYRAAGI